MIKVRSNAVLGLLLLVLYGCTKEDLSVCGLYVVFKYDYNMAEYDKFPSDIDKIDLFVFDQNNVFVGEYIDEGDHLDNTYRMHLDLPPGVYNLIAWGNLRDDYNITQLIPGVTTLEDARLSLKTDDNGHVQQHPAHLYHGSAMQVLVKPDKRHTEIIDMMKNTNFVRITATGLPIGLATRTAPGTPFSCRILGVNGNYNFDNSLQGSDQLIYVPQYNVQSNTLISEFVVMRIFLDGQSRIIVEYHPEDAVQPVVLFNERLVEFIPPGTDLDKQDEYEIELNFDRTFTAISITVNGWTTVLSGVVVG